jgi:hypothetical protein
MLDDPLYTIIAFTVIVLAAIAANSQANRDNAIRNWTAVLGISSAFAAIFTVFTLIAIRGQLVEMQTDSIIRKNEIRARIQRHTTDEITATGLAEPTTLINIGKSDAQDFTGWNQMQFFEPEAADRFDFRKNPDDWHKPVRTTIGPNDSISLETQEILTSDVRKAMNKDGVLIHWGYVEYRDIFPDNPLHFLHWCSLLNFHPTGNGRFTLTQPILYKAECNTSG